MNRSDPIILWYARVYWHYHNHKHWPKRNVYDLRSKTLTIHYMQHGFHNILIDAVGIYYHQYQMSFARVQIYHNQSYLHLEFSSVRLIKAWIVECFCGKPNYKEYITLLISRKLESFVEVLKYPQVLCLVQMVCGNLVKTL